MEALSGALNSFEARRGSLKGFLMPGFLRRSFLRSSQRFVSIFGNVQNPGVEARRGTGWEFLHSEAKRC